jgi:hypothetical protein
VWSWLADAIQIGQGVHGSGWLDPHDVVLLLIILTMVVGWLRNQKKQLAKVAQDWEKLNNLTESLIEKVESIYCSSQSDDSDRLIRREECLHILETLGAQADGFEQQLESITKERYSQYVNLINTLEKIARTLDQFMITGEERREEMRKMIHEMSVEMNHASNGLFKICEMLIGRLPSGGINGIVREKEPNGRSET